MARPLPTRFPSLDAEPKSAAPPAYRTLTNTASSDSWSVGSHDNKRKSWTGLVDSNENLNKYRVNQYPRVHENQQPPALMQRHTYFGSACQLGQVSSAPLAHQTNSSMSNMSDIITFAMPKGQLPVRADPSFIPAGSVGGGSYPPSESLAPIQPEPRPEVPAPPSKRNRLQEWKRRCCSSRMTMLCFCAIFFLAAATIVTIVVTQALYLPKSLQMMWQAPPAYRGGQAGATHIDVNGETPNRIRYGMKGALPFKGNFIAYYDFTSGKAVIVDESLKKNGEQFACFVLPIDMANTPSYEEMLKAAARAKSRIGQPEGWDEDWTMVPSPMEANQAKSLFAPPIPECASARWIQLQKASSDQRNQKCTECHDFCLPEFGVQGQGTDGYLNIVRRDCFYLFVPEWRSYAQANTAEMNQRDFEAFYRNRSSQLNGNAASGAKWIPLAGMQPSQPYGPSSPSSIPSPGMQPMQQGMQQQQNGYNMGMQPYGINQQPQPQPMQPGQQQMQQPGSFQPYGVQPGQQQPQQGMQQPNGMGTGSLYQNGVSGLPQQIANAGQSAINTIGNAVTDVGQGVSGLYNNLQQAGSQAVDQFGNAISNAQQSIAGVVNMPSGGGTGGTGSSIGVGGYGQRLLGYGSGGTSGVVANTNGGSSVDWQGRSQSGQTTYPGGFVPDGLRATNLEAGIPGVNNPQYYQNGAGGQQQRMGDLTGYAPNVVSTQQGLQQIGGGNSNDPRQMAGVIGMSPASAVTQSPSSGYVPDVMSAVQQPQQQQQLQQQQQSLPANQYYGRGR